MGGMPLLDSFISEVLRIPTPRAFTRRLAIEDVELMGHLVRKGTLIGLNFAAAHSDENIFPKATELVPHRYMSSKTRPILTLGAPGSAYHCSGFALAKMQLRVVLSVLIRDYTFVLDDGQTREFNFVPVIAPKSYCYFIQRTPNLNL